MRLSNIGGSATVICSVTAFPRIPISPNTLNKLSERYSSSESTPFEERTSIPFDPVAQHVNVNGLHAWQAPDFAAGDQRGPCPGLNALANHGYLPRNGIAPWEDIATVTTEVFGLGSDIAGFLSVYGAIFDGNILSVSPGYSIGGPSNLVQNILGGGGIIGTPQGLSASHNKYESDASSARGDLYTDGNDYKLNITRYQMLYDLSPAPGNYDLRVWSHHRKNMFELSKHENPYFFYALFAGPIGSTGGFTFPPRMFANKSTSHPDNGLLTRSILNSFFSIKESSSGKLTYTYGHERIPSNFYKRHPGNEYTAEKFFEDFLMFAKYFPEIASIGGNTGKVDSYAALDLGNFTGGVYEGKNFLGPGGTSTVKCFIFQSLLAVAPDVIKGGYSTGQEGIMQTLLDQVNNMLGDETCPQISMINREQFSKYPGYKKYKGSIL